MSSPTGFVGMTLEGTAIAAATQAPVEQRRAVKSLFEGGPGTAQEQLAWLPAGYPVRIFKRSWKLAFQHLRDLYDTVEDILAGPGPFDFVFWKLTHHRYLGDGARVEFFLPHSGGVATDTLTPPGGISVTPFLPVVKIGLAATALTYTKVSAGTYATGPATGNVYFLENSDRFKLAVADTPAALDDIVVRYVPLYQVIEAGEPDKRYGDPIREPRGIELREI